VSDVKAIGDRAAAVLVARSTIPFCEQAGNVKSPTRTTQRAKSKAAAHTVAVDDGEIRNVITSKPSLRILIPSTTIRSTRLAPIRLRRASFGAVGRFNGIPDVAAGHAVNDQPIGVRDALDHQHTAFLAQLAFHRV